MSSTAPARNYVRRSLNVREFSETHAVPLLDNVELQRALAR